MENSKKIIVSVICFIVFFAIGFGLTYVFDEMKQEGRKMIIFFFSVISFISSIIIPLITITKD